MKNAHSSRRRALARAKQRVRIADPIQAGEDLGEVGSVAGRITVACDDEVDDAAVAGGSGDAAVAGEVGGKGKGNRKGKAPKGKAKAPKGHE